MDRPRVTLTSALTGSYAIDPEGELELWPVGLYEKLMDALSTLTPLPRFDDPAAVERAARKHFVIIEKLYIRAAQRLGFRDNVPETWDNLMERDQDEYLATMADALRAAEGDAGTCGG